MFQPTRGGGGGGGRQQGGRGLGIKLMISNLDYGVSTADIKVFAVFVCCAVINRFAVCRCFCIFS